MPVGVYKRKPKTLETRKKTRTSDFFKTEEGKKWFEYDGNLQDNEDYVYASNQYYYLKKRIEKDPDYKPGQRRGPKLGQLRGPRGCYSRKKTTEEAQATRKEKYDLYQARQQEKIWCSCGKQVRRGYILTHQSTNKHILAARLLLDALPPPPQEWLDEIEQMDKPKKIKLNILWKIV